MDAEGLSTHDFEIIYGQLERVPDFNIPYVYPRYIIPPLTPMEDYFSQKKTSLHG